MTKTNIEWADKSWNCVTGCERVSPGCDNCYAIRMSKRLQSMSGPAGAKYAGTVIDRNNRLGPGGNASPQFDWSGIVRCH